MDEITSYFKNKETPGFLGKLFSILICPFMFLNDIADDIQSLVRLFADDRLNLDLHALDNWAKQWLVNFNPKNTEYMVISFQQNVNPINLKFNSQNLNQVDNHKHLGVTIYSNCKWAKHINNICQKATKQIFFLRKLKFILNRNNLNKIYVTYILPLPRVCM
jgi:hypothetical protein